MISRSEVRERKGRCRNSTFLSPPIGMNMNGKKTNYFVYRYVLFSMIENSNELKKLFY
jgi:hypothetical protein